MRRLLLLLLFLPLSAFAVDDDLILLGVGVRSRPEFDGSNKRTTELIPVVRYYGKTLFARTTQGILEGGARLEINHDFHLGAQLAYEAGRKSSEAEFLASRNVPDINPGASAGVHAEWDYHIGPVPTTLLARVRQFVDTDRGTQADLRFTAGVFGAGAVSAGVFIQGTWADSRSNQSFYGITPDVAASTGLPVYTPGGGLLYTTGGLLWGVDLSKSWIVIGNLEARLLHGAAAGSPLVERSTSRYASASLAYRWY